MGSFRQLDLPVTTLTSALVLLGFIVYIGLSIKVSFLIAVGVFVAGLSVGRTIGRVLDLFSISLDRTSG